MAATNPLICLPSLTPAETIRACHEKLRVLVDELADGIKQRIGPKPALPEETAELRALAATLHELVEVHAADEERSIFPRVRAAASPEEGADALVVRLVVDHRWGLDLHAQLDRLLERWGAEGRLDSTSSVALAETVNSLRRLYHEHIDLENAALGPLVERVLGPAEIRAICSEMRERREPQNLEAGRRARRQRVNGEG